MASSYTKVRVHASQQKRLPAPHTRSKQVSTWVGAPRGEVGPQSRVPPSVVLLSCLPKLCCLILCLVHAAKGNNAWVSEQCAAVAWLSANWTAGHADSQARGATETDARHLSVIGPPSPYLRSLVLGEAALTLLERDAKGSEAGEAILHLKSPVNWRKEAKLDERTEQIYALGKGKSWWLVSRVCSELLKASTRLGMRPNALLESSLLDTKCSKSSYILASLRLSACRLHSSALEARTDEASRGCAPSRLGEFSVRRSPTSQAHTNCFPPHHKFQSELQQKF